MKRAYCGGKNIAWQNKIHFKVIKYEKVILYVK